MAVFVNICLSEGQGRGFFMEGGSNFVLLFECPNMTYISPTRRSLLMKNTHMIVNINIFLSEGQGRIFFMGGGGEKFRSAEGITVCPQRLDLILLLVTHNKIWSKTYWTYSNMSLTRTIGYQYLY